MIWVRTVNGNGNTLVESVAISTYEGWDLAELVDLEVLGGDTLGWLSLNDLNVDVVGLSHSANGGGAGVTLLQWLGIRQREVEREIKHYIQKLEEDTYRVGVKLSKW